ncbi:MAG: glycosyltransferase [Planctomycetota bacterium]
MQNVEISVVVPVYSGAETLRQLTNELENTRKEWVNLSLGVHLLEVIFVDDGSTDASSSVLRDLAGLFEWCRVVTLSRNFGQHPATMAGILQTSGDWVVTLDEDLQHPPNAILSLLEQAVSVSLDVVYAKPLGAVHASSYRDATSKLLKFLVSRISGIPHVRDFNSFRVIRGSIARAAAAVSAHETYFDVALCWFTESVGACPVALSDHRYKSGKRSSYSLRRLLSHARRLLISSQTRLLRAGAVIGVGAVVLSFLIGAYKLTQRLVDPAFVDVPGWTSLFLAILFFGGLNSLLLGIMLEYLWTMLLQAQGKPTFFSVDRSKDAILATAILARKVEIGNAALPPA